MSVDSVAGMFSVFSLQLGEQLRQLMPMCGLTVLDLEVDGTCLQFSPLMTAAGKAITTLPLWLNC